jgi:hypothetical protein
VAIWLMNGTQVTSVAGVGNVPVTWAIAGTGDFNGDGKSDILWRDATSGAAAIWLMNGTQVTQAANVGSASFPPWSIPETGDFNGDGKSDILWRNTASGDGVVWFMNGAQILGYADYGSVSLVWSIQPTTYGYAWPGQQGNPVGYAAYAPLGTTVWTGGSLQSGTSQNPTVYKGYIFNGVTISVSNVVFISCDFNSGTGSLSVEGSNISFIGSRFQSNSLQNANVVLADGVSNISFSYSSFTPLATYYTSPPGEVWPSAGAGKNAYIQVSDVTAINGNKGYEYGLLIGNNSGPVTVDHSDIWGFGNAISILQTTAQMTFTNNWIHDAADYVPQDYHTDGIGYLNGGAGPSNVLIQGNTIATQGTTNGIAFQQATSGYNNIQIIHNYLSGFGYTVAPGSPTIQHFTNSSFVGNVLGTDIMPWFGPLDDWFQTSNVWKCNAVHVTRSTAWTTNTAVAWTPTTAQDGLYWVPTSNVTSSTDWQGNTSCP